MNLKTFLNLTICSFLDSEQRLKAHNYWLLNQVKEFVLLNLNEIFLAFFVQYIDEDNREKYEKEYADEISGVTVIPIFLTTGE